MSRTIVVFLRLSIFWLTLLLPTDGSSLDIPTSTFSTIRDVIYGPDGRPFNGTITLEPEQFGELAPPVLVVQVIDGMFSAKVVPTPPGSPLASYTATYSAQDSPIHWVEIWRVPQRDQLSLNEVRPARPATSPPIFARKKDGDTNIDVRSVGGPIAATTSVVTDLPAETGTAGYLVTDGTTASWGNIATGGSGALDCATVPGVCDVVTAIVPLKPSANAWTGANDFSGAAFLRLVTGSGAPATGCSVAANAGSVYMRSDAQTLAASLYVCSQTGSGIYSWELAQASALPVYRADGIAIKAHIVTGNRVLASSQLLVPFSGAAAFNSALSYECTANDTSSPTAVLVSQRSGSAVTFSIQGGSPTDHVNFTCVGF